MVAVDHEVVRGDRGGKAAVVAAHIVGGIGGGDMFHDHAQRGMGAADRVENAVDKDGFAVEDVDCAVGDFSVGAERQADLGHAVEHGGDLVEIGHAAGGIGGGARRVEFDGVNQALGMGAGHVIGVGVLGQVEGHQRGEIRAFGQGRHDPVAVGGGLGAGHHWGHEVRHDNGAGEVAGAMRQYGAQHVAVAQVQVPVVGTADREALCHGRGASTEWGRAPD